MRDKIFVSLLSSLASLLLAGCANPINAYTARNYSAAGAAAEESGDISLARQNYSRSYINAKIGNLGPAAEAHALYEYARATGYAGKYSEAEAAFEEVLALIAKSGGKANSLLPPALAEYSRLLHDTAQHRKALPVFAKATVALEKEQIQETDPLGYAAFLDDYAQSLSASGQAQRASAMTTRSASLKATHKGTSPSFVPKRYR